MEIENRKRIRELILQRDLSALVERGLDGRHWTAKHFAQASMNGEFDRLEQFVDPARAAIDVGANVGAYSLKLAALCPKVLAIEPLGPLAGIGEYLPGNCTVAPVAAGEKEATLDLHTPLVEGHAVGGLSSLRDPATFGYPESTRQSVRVKRLDDLVVQMLPDVAIGFVKIDAEGWELPVLRGAPQLLRDHRPALLVEIWPQEMPESAEEIERMGYRGLFFFDGRLCDVSQFDWAIHCAPENDWDPRHPGRFNPDLHVNRFWFLPRK